jgi:hypothetical protein
MSSQIYAFDKTKFPLDDVTLANPQGLQGGAFFSKLKLLGNSITLQTPRCKTKNGVVKTEKKIYCDLMFEKDDDDVIDFLENLEDKIKNLIYEKKDKWFHSDMDMDTIDYHWQNILRSYKGSKILLRCFIKKPKSRLNTTPALQIYDEDESLLKMDDLTKEKSIMGLLEISGLKFTSQSFSLEFNLTQAMVLKDKVFRNKCLIKTRNNTTQEKKDEVEDIVQDSEENVEQDNEENVEQDNEENVEQDNEENVEQDSEENVEQNGEENVEQDNEENIPTLKLSELQSKNIKLTGSEPQIDTSPISKKDEDTTNVNQITLTNLENTESLVEDLAKSEDKIEENPERIIESDGKLLVNTEPLEKNSELNEINLVMPEDKDIVQLKKPNEVYMEIYKEVKRRAKAAKKKAIAAYLEAKRIKSLYLLDEIESSDDETDLLEMTTN